MSNADIETKSKTQTELRQPSLWRVIFHNDDFTPMDFVIYVLQRFFGKTVSEATELMLVVHQRGQAQVAIFTREIALQKVSDTMALAEENGHPLRLTAEEAG